ncbi:MAG: DUF503 domain-containing protein [Capsulimonadaceae bacterium]
MPHTVVGLLTARLRIEGAQSLKDKRQVLRSLVAHLRNEFNVSVAEVDTQDLWQVATIAVAHVASDGRFVNEVLDKVVDHIERDPRAELEHDEIEML